MKPYGKTIVRSVILLMTAFVSSASIYSAAVPDTRENPNTFLGPIGRVGVTSSMTDDTAFSLFAEGGPKNYRVNGTMGWQIDFYNRIKASAELLRQRIDYSFFDGVKSPWVSQGAIGLDYQYDFHQDAPYNSLVSLSAYYSHAPSQYLGTGSGSYLNSSSNTDFYTVNHRVAGANAAGFSPAVTIIPWEGTNATLALNYDSVRYDTVYRSRSADESGFGGTLSVDQALTDDLNFGLSGAVRQPFTHYQANVSYNLNSPYGLWVLSLFGAYTYGKYPLPSTYNLGLGVNYLVDAVEEVQVPVRTMPMPYYKDSPAPVSKESALPKYKDTPVRQYKDAPLLALPTEWQYVDGVNKNFLSWVSKPAVYMPQVLAVPDQRVTHCIAPTFSGTIDDDNIFGNTPYTLDTSVFFTGSSLVYTSTTLPLGLTIDSATGVISGTVSFFADTTTVTVTATNSCGSASSNSFTLFFD